MRCGLLSPSWNHEGFRTKGYEVARDRRPDRVSHLPQPASYLALRCRPPSGDPIRPAALGVLPGSLSAAGRGQRRRSIKMTRTMITIRTTVPMPIYIGVLPWGDACSCRCLRVRLPSPVRINQKPAARATPTIRRRWDDQLGTWTSHAEAGGWAQAGAKRSLSPALPSTARNHSADAPVPAGTRWARFRRSAAARCACRAGR